MSEIGYIATSGNVQHASSGPFTVTICAHTGTINFALGSQMIINGALYECVYSTINQVVFNRVA